MKTLQIDYSDETKQRLEEFAQEQGLSAEDFVRRVTELVLQQSAKEFPSNEGFDKAEKHIIEKNKELYRRLAM